MREATEQDLVELAPARRGADLYAVVEAGQYARLVDHEAPVTAEEAEAMAAFVAYLNDCCETWDRKSAMEQSAALASLGALLDRLDECEYAAFWAVAERQFSCPPGDLRALPVAVVKIARSGADRVSVRVPLVIEAESS